VPTIAANLSSKNYFCIGNLGLYVMLLKG